MYLYLKALDQLCDRSDQIAEGPTVLRQLDEVSQGTQVLNLRGPRQPWPATRATPVHGWGARRRVQNPPRRGIVLKASNVAQEAKSASTDDDGDRSSRTGSGINFGIGYVVEPADVHDVSKA